MSIKVRYCVRTVRVRLSAPYQSSASSWVCIVSCANLQSAGLSNAHEEEEAVDLSQITYEREETEKSRDNKQAIKEAL